MSREKGWIGGKRRREEYSKSMEGEDRMSDGSSVQIASSDFQC